MIRPLMKRNKEVSKAKVFLFLKSILRPFAQIQKKTILLSSDSRCVWYVFFKYKHTNNQRSIQVFSAYFTEYQMFAITLVKYC